jgi:hypothetical protein
MAIGGIVFWDYFVNTNTSGESARWQESGESIPFWNPAIPPGGVFDHHEFPWRYPSGMQPNATVITRHRYPATAGPELSAILRKGMAGFTAGPPQDQWWIEVPPTSAMW